MPDDTRYAIDLQDERGGKRKDNATAHSASEYDENIRKTIPHYDDFHEAVIDTVSAMGAEPEVWVDVGCGTGTLVENALIRFPSTTYYLCDPSAAMLEVTRRRLGGRAGVTIFPPVDARGARLENGRRADVVTAIQSLHYQDLESRKASIANCHGLLRDGGLFVSFENIRPLTDRGTEIGKSRWRRFQERSGRSPAEAERHLARFGVEYFPITVEEYLRLLRDVGFRTVEVLWYSCMQAGFYGIR